MSDRIFGLIALGVALFYVWSATAIQTSFLSDPMGPRAFPYIIGGVMAVSALFIVLMPDEEPVWPKPGVFLKIAFAVVVLIAYAESLRPAGFLLPTAVAAGILSYQISPRIVPAILTGVLLSVGLFVVFKYGLGLGLFPIPREWLG